MSKFVVIGPSRSGSTVLCNTLDQHSALLCSGELLAPRRILRVSERYQELSGVAGWSVEDRNRDVSAFLAAHTESPDLPVGFKVLLSHLDPDFVRFPAIKSAIPYDVDEVFNFLAGHQVKIIFLWRRNLVARLDSDLRRKLKRGWNGKILDALTAEKCQANFDMQIAGATRVLARLRAAGCAPPICLDYEDLLSDRDRITEIYDAVGATDDGTRIPPLETRSAPSEIPSVAEKLSPRQCGRYSDVACPRRA